MLYLRQGINFELAELDPEPIVIQKGQTSTDPSVPV